MIEDRYKYAERGADHYTLSCGTLDELFVAVYERCECLEIIAVDDVIELHIDHEVLAQISTANKEEATNASARLVAEMHRHVREMQAEQDAEIEPTLSASERN